MGASRHVIRRPEALPDAVPEMVEEITNSTMRIDVVNLDPLLAESRDVTEVEDADAEIVVVAEGSQELPRLDRNRLAHTLPRVAKQAPAAAIAPVPAAAIAPPPAAAIAPVPAPAIAPVPAPAIAPVPQLIVVDDSRPIDELAEARPVAAQITEVPLRRRVGIVLVVIALASAVAIAATYV